MKILIAVLLGIATTTTFGQNSQTVDMRWKIGNKEKLRYSTVMNVLDTSSIEMNLGGLFKALSDSSKNSLNESSHLFNKINESFNKQDYITTLTNNGKGVINIVMETKQKDTSQDSVKDTSNSKGLDLFKHMKVIQSMSDGVILRGSVYETGGIHSFWLKSGQKNLIALLFELPAKPVAIGDKWSLDISFIGNDQNFDCDSSYKINEVTLADVKKVSGETIAVLKYDIVEYVKGNFNSPSFLGNVGGQKETMMKFSHQGIAEFSVSKGRWVKYDGIMSLEATGIMTANKKTKFTLIDEKYTSR